MKALASSEDLLPEAIRDAAATWLIERDSGALDPERETAFAAWLTADPRHATAYARLDRSWDLMGNAAIDDRPGRIVRFPIPAIARRLVGPALAASLLLLVIGTAQDWPTRLRANAMTATGEQRELVLADGTKVRLNTASAIAVDYSDDRRTVRLLKGEASFRVAADRARPFTVEAAGGSATALGTRFVVRRDEDETDVAVTEHSVRVAAPSGTAGIVVAEGRAVRYGQDGVGPTRAIDITEAEAWTRGRMFFVDRPLGEVVAEIDRYHPGLIRVVGDELGKRRFSGVLPTGDPMGALDTIQRTLGIGSTRITDQLVFLHG